MKIPEEIIHQYQLAMSIDEEIAVIESAQNEAYNQAIKDAAESARANCRWSNLGPDPVLIGSEVDKESILKLLKQ